MAARRCPICAINFPTTVGECRVCDGDLDQIEADPDPDWEEQVARRQLAPSRIGVELLDYRVEQLKRLGFPDFQAAVLADLPDLDLHEVERAIAVGCPRDVAFSIFS